MPRCVLLDDDFYPITAEVGLLRAKIASVAPKLLDWLMAKKHPGKRWVSEDARVSTLRLGLEQMLPLQRVERSKYLLVPCRGDWTAVFSNRWRTSTMGGEICVLAGVLGTDGLVVAHNSDVPRVQGKGLARYANCKLEYFEPEPGQQFGRTRRAIQALHDGNRWVFDSAGDPLPFEEVEAYQRPRIRDRFSCTELMAYVSEFDVDPFDADAYRPGGAMLLRRLDKFGNDEDVSLEETQRSWKPTQSGQHG